MAAFEAEGYEIHQHTLVYLTAYTNLIEPFFQFNFVDSYARCVI